MLNKQIKLLLIFFCAIFLIAASVDCKADQIFIDITNPFLKKIPIAVPNFKAAANTPDELEYGVSSSQMLSNMLNFSGYFKLSDPGAFLIEPQKAGITAGEIKFRNWTAIGAEMLITGRISVEGSMMEMELRIFDTVKEKLLIGKRYKGWKKDQRKVLRKFCGEIIFQLTGNRGVFDSRLAFVSNGSGHKEIYLCEFDGSNPQKFTDYKSISLFPAWSSNGKWMAFTSYVNGKPDIIIKNIKENRSTNVSKKGLQIAPSWIPDRFELAATMSFSGDQEIYLLSGSGKVIKRLTRSRGIDVEPTFSPDGKKMAFVSKRSGTPQIYIKNLSTNQVERLTYEGRYNTQPAWSPKGNKIAYSGMKDGEINIYTIHVEKGYPVQLTINQADNEAPTWSPDGSLIAFSSNREGLSKIYVMTAFGTDQKRLLNMPGEQSGPRWSPNGTIE